MGRYSALGMGPGFRVFWPRTTFGPSRAMMKAEREAAGRLEMLKLLEPWLKAKIVKLEKSEKSAICIERALKADIALVLRRDAALRASKER